MVRLAEAAGAYRWGVALLATVVWVWCFADARIEQFGWQFRCFEVWALSASAVAAVLMLRLSLGWSRLRHAGFVRVTAALNAAVVGIHLLPAVSGLPATELGPVLAPSFKATYLHLIGPVLQIADAVLILGAFRAPLSTLGRAAGGVALVASSYVAWIELAVRPLNARADGRGGLPYGALAPLEPAERLAVYALATLGAVAALVGFWAIQRALDAGRRRSRAEPTPWPAPPLVGQAPTPISPGASSAASSAASPER